MQDQGKLGYALHMVILWGTNSIYQHGVIPKMLNIMMITELCDSFTVNSWSQIESIIHVAIFKMMLLQLSMGRYAKKGVVGNKLYALIALCVCQYDEKM